MTEAKRTSQPMSRRTLCLGIGGAVALLAFGGVRFIPSEPLIRPPGGQDEERLQASCIRCEKCYEVCPRQVIVPSHIEDGIMQVRTPTLKYSYNWCDYCIEENGGDPLCVKTCPTEALSLPEGATVHNTIIGEAVLVRDWCLAWKDIGCKFCFDACPYDAIVLDEDDRPSVIAANCNGCGACESVCVSMKNAAIQSGATSRAITVQPLALVELNQTIGKAQAAS